MFELRCSKTLLLSSLSNFRILMRRVFCVGEALIDVVIGPDRTSVVLAGGSMLNTSVSLGRRSIPVHFISTLGKDQQAYFIREYLAGNDVNTSFVTFALSYQTQIAMAWLDKNRNADYAFYGTSIPLNIVEHPRFTFEDILLFGSFYSVKEENRSVIKNMLQDASNNRSLLIYDPNYRSSHKRELNTVIKYVFENISMAHIIKASSEDLFILFGVSSGKEAWDIIRTLGPLALIYTKAQDGAEFFSKDIHISYPSLVREIVSTVGAGDAFNAGIIDGMLNLNKPDIAALDRNDANLLLQYGSLYAADVCASKDNYVRKGFLPE